MPSSQFMKLPVEKQMQIVQASLHEFAKRGYDLASTNSIVEGAAISKGVLFKYFEDKESLFTYVVERTVHDVLSTFPVQEVGEFEDLFEWLKYVAIRKIRFGKEHPLEYRLLMRIAKEPTHPVYAKVLHVTTVASQQFMAELQTLLPLEKLRTGVTWEHVISTLLWISQGLHEKYIGILPDEACDNLEDVFEPILNEIDLYFEIVKKGSYREVCQND